VYTKAWRADTAAASMYRPRAGAGLDAASGGNPEAAEEQLRALQGTSRFAAAGSSSSGGRDFEGVERPPRGGQPQQQQAGRAGLTTGAGPVQFERAAPAASAADPFGLDALLSQTARRGAGDGDRGAGRASGGGRGALDAIGRSAGHGFMAAAAGGGGGGGRSRDDLDGGFGRGGPSREVQFTEAGGRR